MAIKIIKIDQIKKSETKAFINFPFKLYRNNPYWVPPFINDMNFNLDSARHPFYKHSNAAFFIAEKNGQTCGRIAVLNNHIHNEFQNARTAFFCYFDCIQDQEVAQTLLNTAFEWAAKEGLNRIVGPRGLIRTEGSGILIKGFDLRPAVGITYNYPYYEEFFTKAGFEKLTDYYSGYLPLDFTIPEKVKIIAEKVRQNKGYQVKTFSGVEELKSWIPRVGKVFNSAFENRKEYYPINQQELAVIAGNIISIANPELIKLVLKGEEVIGFLLTYPDISEAIQKTKGHLWPFGWVRLLITKKKTRVYNINGLGLLPLYQGLGGNALLYDELYKTGKDIKYDRIEAVQIDEENFLSLSDNQTMRITWDKIHRSYQKTL